jgi:hypothetical protein
VIDQLHPHPEWRIITDALSTRDYGTIITHAEVSTLTRLRYPSPRYFAQVGKARRALIADWQRELQSMPGIGYRLVNPEEFHGRSRRELRLAGPHLRLSAKILIAAPQARLSDADNARNANALAKIGALEAQRRKVATETRPSLPPPRISTPKMLTN